MLRFFHNPLLIAKLAEYDYLIKGNKKQSTAEYKIKRIIKDITGKHLKILKCIIVEYQFQRLRKMDFKLQQSIYQKLKNFLLFIEVVRVKILAIGFTIIQE